jgi:predicted AAA+ superfamily ATPase
VAGLLRAYRDYADLYDELSYWAPAGAAHTEVDFLLERGAERVAVEVKAVARYSEPLARGLRAVAELPALRRRILVYLGQRRLVTPDGIEVLPIRAFLDEVEGGTLYAEVKP